MNSQSYTRRYSKRFLELSWGWNNIVWGAIMALAPFVVLYIKRQKFDWNTVGAALWVYIFIVASYLLVHAIKTVLRLDADREIAYRDVAKKLAISNELLENEHREKLAIPRPDIEVTVKEILIEPSPGRADCFVHVYLHNSAVGAAVTIPSYRITLEIAGKPFSSSALLDTSVFQVVNYVDDDDDMPNLAVSARNDIPDLRDKIIDAMPLERGKPKEGWLAFSVSPVPDWPTHTNVRGTHMAYNDEGEEYPEDELEIVLLPTSVSAFEVAIQDPHGGWHSSGRIMYKKSWYRGVIRRPKK